MNAIFKNIPITRIDVMSSIQFIFFFDGWRSFCRADGGGDAVYLSERARERQPIRFQQVLLYREGQTVPKCDSLLSQDLGRNLTTLARYFRFLLT